MSTASKVHVTGFLALIPSTWVPYAELIRLHKPVGILNIYLPYLLACLFTACVRSSSLPPARLVLAVTVMMVAAFILRSVGCAWNDIIDRDLDKHVTRTKTRPMARGAITTREGYVFCAVQLILWLLVLSVTNPSTLLIALPIIGLATFYPFAKRITDYPQVVLAVTFSWGTLVGAAHLGVKVSEMRVDSSLGAGLMSLFLSYSLWTIIHDTVYAFQDLKDDAKIGAKSMAVKHQNKATRMLVVLSALNVLALFAVGFCINANMVYYIIACGAISIMLSTMVMRLDLMNPHECLWWFQNGSILYGTLNTIALIQEYSSRRL